MGKTFTGHHHDYTMFKTEFDPQQEWFKNLTIYVDLGYQGIKNDYSQGDIQIPIKKPRRSKANPSPSLTPEEKAFNQSVSKARIVVENAGFFSSQIELQNLSYSGKIKTKSEGDEK